MMSLFEALNAYVATREITDTTSRKLRHRINCWLRHGGQQRVDRFTAEDFDAFRQTAAAAGLAKRTIEETVSDVSRIVGQADVGHRLRRWKSSACKTVPSPELLGYAYSRADLATWPDERLCRSEFLTGFTAAEFWRAFLVFGYLTGLRLRDLRSFTWTAFDRGFSWSASKTGRLHAFPDCEWVTRHLAPLRVSGSERIFPVTQNQEYLLRRELHRISGSSDLTPQAIRRCSVTQWTIADPRAGDVVQGNGLGVMASYLSARQLLTSALPRLAVPAEFQTPEERDVRRSASSRILSIVGRVPSEKLADFERVAAAFVG